MNEQQKQFLKIQNIHLEFSSSDDYFNYLLVKLREILNTSYNAIAFFNSKFSLDAKTYHNNSEEFNLAYFSEIIKHDFILMDMIEDPSKVYVLSRYKDIERHRNLLELCNKYRPTFDCLYCPIKYDGYFIGFFGQVRSEEIPFSDGDLFIANAISNVISTAIKYFHTRSVEDHYKNMGELSHLEVICNDDGEIKLNTLSEESNRTLGNLEILTSREIEREFFKEISNFFNETPEGLFSKKIERDGRLYTIYVTRSEAKSFIYAIYRFIVSQEKLGYDYESLKEVYDLTHREIEVVKCISYGYSNTLISERLNLKEREVNLHISNIFKKMNINSKLELLSSLRS